MDRPLKSCLALLVCTMLALSACKKESDDPTWDIDVLAPLVNSTLTLGDIVNDSLLESAPDGALSLVYDLELFGIALDTVIEVPDTTIVERFGLPIPGPVEFPAGTEFYTLTESDRYSFGDLELNELIVREGRIEHQITNMINEITINDFSITNALLNGMPLFVSQNAAPGTPSSPSVTNGSIDLSGYALDLRGPDLNDVNVISTELTSRIDPNGQPVSVTNMDSVLIEVGLVDIVPQYAKGYFGNEEVDVDETVEIDIFENLVDGLIDIDQISVKMRVRNGVGADAQAVIQQVKAINTHNGNEVELQHNIINNAINVNRAVDLGGSVQESLYETVMDNSNSNIDEFFENLPDRVLLNANVLLNPLGDVSNGNDFLYYFSQMEVDMELDLPLCLIATNLTLSSEYDVDLSDGLQTGLNEGMFTLFAENFFPFAADIKIFIIDENGSEVDQLIPNGNVASAIIDGNNVSVQAVNSEIQIPLSEAQADALLATSKLRIDAVFNTADQADHTKLYEEYYMKLKLVGDFNYTINGE